MLIVVTLGSVEKLHNGKQNCRELCSRCNGIHVLFFTVVTTWYQALAATLCQFVDIFQ